MLGRGGRRWLRAAWRDAPPQSFIARLMSVSPHLDGEEDDAMSRLEELRKRMSAGPDLGDFVMGNVGPGTEDSTVKPKKKRRRKNELPKPDWLRIRTPTAEAAATFAEVKKTVQGLNLATVCEEAKCPNIGECWGGEKAAATATIMLMGDTCTRGCRFCAVKTSAAPPPLDHREPKQVAEAIGKWGLGYVVLTSVDRDDLPDQGAGHFAKTVAHLKQEAPDTLVECLTPDFSGREDLVLKVVNSGLDVFAHNVETVERTTPNVRDRRAAYRQSLDVLEMARDHEHVITKTSLMLGVGETDQEIRQTLSDLRSSGVHVVTFGQYLRPSGRHLPVDRYVTPEEFDGWRDEAQAMGFLYVASGPLVRSSYKAGEYYLEGVLRERRAARTSKQEVGV